MPDARTAHAPLTTEDERLDALVRERFAEFVARHPVFATYLGITDHDNRLGDGSRNAILEDAALAHRFEDALNALDPGQLSPYFAIERELALFATQREIFDIEVHRVWERRVAATDEIGDGIFLLFARGTQPLAERLGAIAARLEQAPAYIERQKTHFGTVPPVRLWNEMELEAVESLPSLFDEVVSAARAELGSDAPLVGRLERTARDTRVALRDYGTWLRQQLDAGATDEFALGSTDYDTLVSLRAFDGLTTDDILAIGEQQLAENRAARAELCRAIDAGATEAEVVIRIKSNHPANFDAALAEYRRTMNESRQYVIDHSIATMPAGEKLEVLPTPEYLRSVMPFAAYFSAPKFGAGGEAHGTYVVTPSVGDDPGAMLEHNYASIYNTSIHEAYPGHHQQLSAANEHPSLVRLLIDAPEFVEGWAMYCELMMREQGFSTSPEHRVMMHTDAIWRACRIILDVKLQRGQITVADAIDFLVDQTGFARPNATAEVHRYTYTPTYQLSYLLGRVLLLRLRDDEMRRQGDAFSLGAFHDALLAQGSLPISFQRRLLA